MLRGGNMKTIIILAFLLFSSSSTEAQNLFNPDRTAPMVTFQRLDGNVWQSRDGGRNWARMSGSSVDLNSSFATNRAKPAIYFTRLDGATLVSYDGGSTYWKPDAAPASQAQKVVTPPKVEDQSLIPAVIISSVTPNPAVNELMFNLYVQKNMPFRLTLEDRSGREMRTVFDGVSPLGERQFKINVTDLAEGLYVYVLRTKARVSSGGIIVTHR